MYKEICELYRPYITKEYLADLAHPYSTQFNEAMNHSLSAFAPKGKTFSKTQSLDTRVAIADCTQIVGYERFWEFIFDELAVTFDDNLRFYLRTTDRKKKRRRELAEAKEGKTKRSRSRHEKMNEEHIKDMEAQKQGMIYESGVAMRAATKR